RGRPDLSTALREALPAYEAPAALSSWATEQARRYDMEAHDASTTAPARKHVRTLSRARWQIAAALVCAAALGWAGATLRGVTHNGSAESQTPALSSIHIFARYCQGTSSTFNPAIAIPSNRGSRDA